MTDNIDNILNRFYGVYVLRNVDPDFSFNHRTKLRYAHGTKSISLNKMNPYGPQPFDYLNFAKKDLLSNDTRGSINALANTKRAVHITVEKLLWVLGLEKAYSKSNFPEKLNIMRELEIFPIGVIQLLNKERNYVEHEYASITPKEVEKFIDITELLLLASYPLLRNVTIGAIIGSDEDDECYEWKVDFLQSVISKSLIKNEKYVMTEIGPIHYNFSDKMAIELVEQIEISKKNQEQWLPALSLFAYLTKYNALKLDTEKDEGHYSVNTRRQTFFDI